MGWYRGRIFSDLNNFVLNSTTLKVRWEEFHRGCLHASSLMQYSMTGHHKSTRGKSWQTNPITFNNKTLPSLDMGQRVAVIYPDFSKAFDTGEEVAQGQLHHITPVLKGAATTRTKSILFTRAFSFVPLLRGQKAKSTNCTERGFTSTEEVYSENDHSLEHPPQGCGRVHIPGGFQGVTQQRAR